MSSTDLQQQNAHTRKYKPITNNKETYDIFGLRSGQTAVTDLIILPPPELRKEYKISMEIDQKHLRKFSQNLNTRK